MMPLSVKFNHHDALTMPLDAVNDTQIASWVEDMILDYLDTY